MKKIYLAFLFLLIIELTQAQTKNKSKIILTPTINTFTYILNGMKVQDADRYLNKYSYKFNGSKNSGDTISIVYKNHSNEIISFDLLNEQFIEVDYFTSSIDEATTIIKNAELNGFQYIKTFSMKNNVIYEQYKKLPFQILYTKSSFPEPLTFMISIRKSD